MENDPLVTEEQEEQRVPEIDMSFFKDENINDMSAPSVPEVQAQELDIAQSPPPDPSSSAAGDTSPTTEKPKAEPEVFQEPEEMVPYGDQMVPKSAIEYQKNIFGQQIPFLKPEYEKQQREEARTKDGTGVSQLPVGYNNGPLANWNRVGVASAAGVADTASDVMNIFLPDPFKIPRPTKYEDDVLQTTRVLAGFIIPEMVGIGGLKRLALASHAKVGWKIGNQPWLRFLGNRGIEAGVTGLLQGNKQELDMPGNEFDMVHGALPSFMKWMVPESVRSSHLGDPDEIHGRNLSATMGLGFMIPLVPHAYKMAKGRSAVNAGLDVASPATRAEVNLTNEIELIGNNPTSQAFIESATPKPRDWRLSKDIYDARAQDAGLDIRWEDLRPEQQADNIKYMKESGQIPANTAGDGAETLVDYALEQSDALDELGRYNLSITDDANVPLKGVNDLYDFNEIGMRTVDNYGIVGASIDQARIAGNLDTVYGRLRNMLSPASLKYATNNLDSVDDITLGLARSLDDADDIRVQGPGWSLTNEDLVAAGDNLVLDFIDPSLDVNGIKRLFSPNIKTLKDGTEVLRGGDYNKMLRTFNKLGKEFTDMTVARAQAYVGTSLAGEVSDLSEAARYSRDNKVVVAAAQEKILDNMKYILRLKGSTNYFKNMKSSMVNMWDSTGTVSKQTADQLIENYPAAMKTLNTEIDRFANDLKWAFDNEPELGEAIMELYEITDGRVFDISTVNASLQKSLGGSPTNMLKAMDKDMPNLIGQATRANWFNSLLSPLTSPTKAVVGNLGGILDEPVSYFAGALVRRDMKALQDGWYAYRSMSDIKTKALPLMGRLFEKAVSNDPKLTLATDLDYVLKTDRKINTFKELARAEAAKGNTGVAIMVEEYLNLQALANDPVMKFSSNSMTGLDGLPQAMTANAEAKFRALEEMQRMRDLGEEVSGDILKATATKEYNSMFDSSGLIKDKAAQYSADRIALRVDSPLYQRFNNMIKDFPFMRLMMPFPGMQANVLKLIDETNPAFSFANDVQQLASRSMDSFAENPAVMREVLEAKGYDVNAMDEVAQLGAIGRLKNKTIGRKAIATIAYGTLAGGFLQGNVVGAGLMDKQADKTRRKLLDLPNGAAVKVNGRWLEFKEILGPGYGAWASTIATAIDNAIYIGQGEAEKIAQKGIFVLGASLEDESGFGGLKPMFDLFAGNTNSATRWLAQQSNARLAPMGSLRNQMGEILVGGTRELENDLISMIGAKNKLIDLNKPEGDIPYYTNPVTGDIQNQYDPFTRFYNSISPVKLPSKPDENLNFLKEIGYDYTTLFSEKEGVPLTSTERSKLFTIMGKNKHFKNSVTRIRKYAEKMDYLPKLHAARKAGANSSELSEFMNIEQQLRDAARLAENRAWATLEYTYKKDIMNRSRLKRERENAASMGAVEFIEQLPTR